MKDEAERKKILEDVLSLFPEEEVARMRAEVEEEIKNKDHSVDARVAAIMRKQWEQDEEN